MFVGPGDESDVTAARALKPRHDIGRDRFISVADMRTAIGVADRGGDVEGGALFGHSRALAAGAREGKRQRVVRSGRGARSARHLPISKDRKSVGRERVCKFV